MRLYHRTSGNYVARLIVRHRFTDGAAGGVWLSARPLQAPEPLPGQTIWPLPLIAVDVPDDVAAEFEIDGGADQWYIIPAAVLNEYEAVRVSDPGGAGPDGEDSSP